MGPSTGPGCSQTYTAVFTVRMWASPEGPLGTLSDKPADAQPWGHLPAGPLPPLGDLFSGGLRVEAARSSLSLAPDKGQTTLRSQQTMEGNGGTVPFDWGIRAFASSRLCLPLKCLD